MKATLRVLRAITAIIALTIGALLLLPFVTLLLFALVAVISTPGVLLSLSPTDYLQLFASVVAVPVYVFGLIKTIPELALVVLMVLTLVQFHYKPAFEPAPGYAMQWLSEPNAIEGVVLAYSDMMDGRSREYSLRSYKFSPDCSVLAVVSEAVYGPQDVMILHREK